MKDVFLTALRDAATETGPFRRAANQLSFLLAAETSVFLSKTPTPVTTPIAVAQGSVLRKEPVLVAILRSGLALLPAFVSLYPASPIGCIGIRRDEESALPSLYSSHLPSMDAQDGVFLLDPMIATGQSAALAVKLLKEAGALESKIVLISFLAAPEGVAHIRAHCPKIQMHIAHMDEQLDSKKWIVPGLGDFGNRYFAT